MANKKYPQEQTLIDIMGASHYLRYINGEAEEGIDFLSPELHKGETWEYSESRDCFVRLK